MSKVRIRRLVVGAALVAGVGVVATGGASLFGQAPAAPRAQAHGAPAVTGSPTRASTVATARTDSLAIFDRPDAPEPSRELANPRPSGAPLVLLVADEQAQWLHVMLPQRPNGSTGWVRRADVTTDVDRYRIVVSLSAHRLSAYDGDRVLLQVPAAVGTPATPTPTGRFYTTELLRPPNPTGPYGAYALGLSAHSEVLTDFAGGDGTVGIHGTNDLSSLGTAVSHGCVRVDNDTITTLAQSVPLGTPVTIEP